METAIGHVCSVDDGTITVVVDAPIACRRCAAGKGCGAGLLTGPQKARRIDVIAPPGIRPAVGDTVTLALPPRQLLRAAAIAYGLPLSSLVLSALFAWLAGAGPDSLAAVGIVFSGLAIGFVVSRQLLVRDAVCEKFVPVIDSHLRPRD